MPRGGFAGCARATCLAAVGLEGLGQPCREQSWHLPCPRDGGCPHHRQCYQPWQKGEKLLHLSFGRHFANEGSCDSDGEGTELGSPEPW